MSVMFMLTPNFWAEMKGVVDGFLIREIVISIILALIGTLCAVAGAGAMAARIAGVVAKLRKTFTAAGKVGKVFVALFKYIDDLVELIGRLSKALRKKIDEAVEGATGAYGRILRLSKRGVSKRPATVAEHARGSAIRNEVADVGNAKVRKKANRGGGSVAYADANIDGQSQSLKALSGNDNIPGFVENVPNAERKLPASILDGETMPRSSDGEAKVFEIILSQTDESSNGSIKVFTERAMCDSCTGVTKEFQRLSPNIIVEVVEGVGPG